MNLLIVEDDKLFLNKMSITFKNAGYNVTNAKTGDEAFDAIFASNLDLIICNVEMKGLSDTPFISLLKSRFNIGVHVIVISKLEAAIDILNTLNIDAMDFLEKPFDVNKLLCIAEQNKTLIRWNQLAN
jgi:DNA-binding response OmpR family regulator